MVLYKIAGEKEEEGEEKREKGMRDRMRGGGKENSHTIVKAWEGYHLS